MEGGPGVTGFHLSYHCFASGLPLFTLCSWARNSSNREQHTHSQGYAAFLEMHTLRDSHTKAPNREYAMRILRDQSVGAKGNR